ncbi:hypothetical protein [Streptomyces sp. NPDC002845]
MGAGGPAAGVVIGGLLWCGLRSAAAGMPPGDAGATGHGRLCGEPLRAA